MTKWVTVLLLVLAALVYGMSRLRPVPEPEVAVTPAVRTTFPSSVTTPEVPDPVAVKQPVPPPGRTTRGPNFVGSKPSDPTAPGKGPTSSPGKSSAPIKGSVKAAMLSDSSEGSSKTRFTPEAEAVYLTMTPELIKDDVELVARYRSVVKSDSKFSKDFESSGPPRRRTFRLVPPEKGWESGPYQVVISPRGSQQVVGMARFDILKRDEEPPVARVLPEYLDLVPDLEAIEAQNTFSAADKELFLRVDAQALESGSTVRTVWSAVEAEQLTSGELIDISTQPAPGEGRDAVFSLAAPPKGFQAGSYKVEVYFDDTFVGSESFTIEPPSSDK